MKAKEKFYNFIYKTFSGFYSFMDKTILTSCLKGFEEISDSLVDRQSDNIEAFAFLIEHGNNEEWAEIRKIGEGIRKRKRK